eukprot:TRINITY_DN38349_c0_g1_i1.p1 TRINITY_DN38349_c0_g1~~TRINITY_DN38349_c0_g1_i1.p1  ORF type:complete len:510 (-),score=86.56 TRINITY_DN38349_c0_g1_i1:1182-2504(-)
MEGRSPLSVDVAIVGGAMAGLTLAIGLQRLGLDAHVFEAAPELRTDSGTIISVANNGHFALDGIYPGLSAKLRERSAPIKHTRVVNIEHGEVATERVNPWTNGLAVVGWRTAQEIFASLVKPELTHTGHRLKSFKAGEDDVEAVFELGPAKEQTLNGVTPGTQVVRAKLLVGADGLRSAVRKLLIGDDPRFVRIVNWNAIVPNSDFSTFGGHERGEICIRKEKQLTNGLYTFLLDAGEGQSYWQVGKFDPDEELSKSLGPNWGGFGNPGAKERVLQHLKDAGPAWEPLKQAVEATDEKLVFERRVMERLPIDKWSDPTKRVVLMGDAAHAMYPGPGEGARQAFEDAHQLTEAIEMLAMPSLEPAAIAAAVTRFEERRVIRCTRLQRFACEATALPKEIRLSPEIANLSEAEVYERFMEYLKWVVAYPDKWSGDPDSKWWK